MTRKQCQLIFLEDPYLAFLIVTSLLMFGFASYVIGFVFSSLYSPTPEGNISVIKNMYMPRYCKIEIIAPKKGPSALKRPPKICYFTARPQHTKSSPD